MKNELRKESNIHSLKIYGNTILIDYNKEEIIFPEDINQDEIEHIASYLVEEGFINTQLKE